MTVASVGLLGYGEVGQVLAKALAPQCTLRIYDPAYPAGSSTAGKAAIVNTAREAVERAAVVIAVTTGGASVDAAKEAAPHLPAAALYIDLSTNDPSGKREVARIIDRSGAVMVDGAIMAPITPRGFQTPLLLSGPAAAEFASTAIAWGMTVTDIGGQPGDAAARKLLRSVLVKGLSALVIESLRAAENAGLSAWFQEHLLSTITEADDRFLARLLAGAGEHRVRRVHEMHATAGMLTDLGIVPTMTSATAQVLNSIETQGLPALSQRRVTT